MEEEIIYEKQDINVEISDLLFLIGEYHQNKNKWEYYAYLRAAGNIRKFPFEIFSGYQAFDMITGVGASISSKINYYLSIREDNKNLILEDYEQEYIKKDKDFKKIVNMITSFGIGFRESRKLYKKGVRTIKDLYETTNSELCKTLISWRLHLEQDIPREEVEEFKQKLNKINIEYTIVGAYRRGESSFKEIHIVVRDDNEISLSTLIYNFLYDLLIEVLTLSDQKATCILKLDEQHVARKVIITYVNPSYYGGQVFYYTGPRRFLEEIYLILRKKKLSLTQYGIFHVNEHLVTETEEDVFNYAEIKYLEPHRRSEENIEYL